jgi:hypothetical protein
MKLFSRFECNPFAVWFKDPAPSDVLADQLRQVQLNFLYHSHAAARHTALADMYKAEVNRLQGVRAMPVPDENYGGS